MQGRRCFSFDLDGRQKLTLSLPSFPSKDPLRGLLITAGKEWVRFFLFRPNVERVELPFVLLSSLSLPLSLGISLRHQPTYHRLQSRRSVHLQLRETCAFSASSRSPSRRLLVFIETPFLWLLLLHEPYHRQILTQSCFLSLSLRLKDRTSHQERKGRWSKGAVASSLPDLLRWL